MTSSSSLKQALAKGQLPTLVPLSTAAAHVLATAMSWLQPSQPDRLTAADMQSAVFSL